MTDTFYFAALDACAGDVTRYAEIYDRTADYVAFGYLEIVRKQKEDNE